MSYSITLIWSFRNRLPILKKSLLTAHKTCPISVNFCLVDAASDEDTIRQLRTFCNSLKGRKIRICENAYRTSLSEAWNLGIMLSETRYVIFASSDVEFLNTNWFKSIEKMITVGYEYILIDNHAVFALDKKIIPILGWFDERYEIGPAFDVDYLIRATESKIKLIIVPKNNSYSHSDTLKVTKERKIMDVKDRLPMHDDTNIKIFKEKWQTSWPGWQDSIHPPAHISQVKRMYKEIDPHPFYTKKYKELYKDLPHKKIIKGIKRIPIKISQRLSK